MYTHLVDLKNEDYVARIVHSEEACQLIGAGFEFVCDINGHKLFRKKKY
jgi:hypothetical protein